MLTPADKLLVQKHIDLSIDQLEMLLSQKRISEQQDFEQNSMIFFDQFKSDKDPLFFKQLDTLEREQITCWYKFIQSKIPTDYYGFYLYTSEYYGDCLPMTESEFNYLLENHKNKEFLLAERVTEITNQTHVLARQSQLYNVLTSVNLRKLLVLHNSPHFLINKDKVWKFFHDGHGFVIDYVF